jgi:lysosomal Pro-X carboxypeptidase
MFLGSGRKDKNAGEREPMLAAMDESVAAGSHLDANGARYCLRDLRPAKALPILLVMVLVIVGPLNVFMNLQIASIGTTTASNSSPSVTSLRHAFDDAETSFTSAEYNFQINEDGTRDVLQYCDENFFTQKLDHFSAKAETYEQRYFTCGKHFRKESGVIFFYVGNEADVELYLNNTGLMWENAQEFGALLVFSEHRYFGKSIPYGVEEVKKHMEYLSSEQALADYAVLIGHIKESYEINVPVIGFGGSYGGMLGSWFRMKYPNVIDGVIAASAPIAAFLGDEKSVDMESFAKITTFDASPEAGSSEKCISNVRQAWQVLFELGETSKGREEIASAFSLCPNTSTLSSLEDVLALAFWAKSAFDYLAMGNFPYPSSYIMNGQSILPAFPVRVACGYLKKDFSPEDKSGLLKALANGIGVYYNSTADKECYDLNPPSNESALDDNFWNYLYCSELYMPSSVNGVDDMFWSIPWNLTADTESCMAQWNVTLRPKWAVTQFGGRKGLRAASNIVLSNGNYDPWSGTGILDTISDSVVAIKVEGGAHHLDLFFSHKLDPFSLKQVRQQEKEHMWKWVHEFYLAQQQQVY